MFEVPRQCNRFAMQLLVMRTYAVQPHVIAMCRRVTTPVHVMSAQPPLTAQQLLFVSTALNKLAADTTVPSNSHNTAHGSISGGRSASGFVLCLPWTV